MTHNKTYIIPNDKLINGYTRQICQSLAQKSGDPSYNDVQLMNGLAYLLKLVAQVEVKHRNNRSDQ